MNYFAKNLLVLFFLAILAGLLVEKIDLTTADLGRHLKNGETILSGDFSVLNKNFYSYAYPNYPFVNHHWLSGVVFYLVEKISGFNGLSVFYVLLNIAAFLVFFAAAVRLASFEIAAVVSVIILPIISLRPEIRPEIFTYLFSGIFFLILANSGKSWRWLWLLPILEIFWVNFHILFIFGIVIIAAFLIGYLIDFLRERSQEAKASFFQLSAVFISAVSATLLNPAGLNGALYPFKLFRQKIYDNGYLLFEDQSFRFIENIFGAYPAGIYFKIVLGILIASFIFYFIHFFIKKTFFINTTNRIFITNFLLAIFFSSLAWLAIRSFTLFGYFALPLIAFNFRGIASIVKIKEKTSSILFAVFIILSAFLFVFINPQQWENRQTGIGLIDGINQAADFFKQNNLFGPIFNNYDIGGYLIYHLFPKEKAFVDNRPEAYPSSFFKEKYIPMQEQELIWQELSERYGFNAIFFYRLDATPWAQPFLIKRIDDQKWIPVFVDDYTIIFLKNNPQNQEITEKYKIPREIFSVIKT